MGGVVVTTTVDSEAAARRLAEAMVAEGLAACVQVSGPIQSLFRWQGELTWAAEWTCAAKTTPEAAPALMTRLHALHPYDVPEVLATRVDGSAPYLAWVAGEVRRPA